MFSDYISKPFENQLSQQSNYFFDPDKRGSVITFAEKQYYIEIGPH